MLRPKLGRAGLLFDFFSSWCAAVCVDKSGSTATAASSSDSNGSSKQQSVGAADDLEPLFLINSLVDKLQQAEDLLELGTLLQEAGVALCHLLPVPWCCNNPSCQSMAGGSELQLVGGKGCVCAGCRVAR